MESNSFSQSYLFFIPYGGCGTISTETRRDGTIGLKNIVIFQNDPEFQEVWDRSKKLSCDWVSRIDKVVTFAPFSVDMLQHEEVINQSIRLIDILTNQLILLVDQVQG